jgi:hypothetical protein
VSLINALLALGSNSTVDGCIKEAEPSNIAYTARARPSP